MASLSRLWELSCVVAGTNQSGGHWPQGTTKSSKVTMTEMGNTHRFRRHKETCQLSCCSCLKYWLHVEMILTLIFWVAKKHYHN